MKKVGIDIIWNLRAIPFNKILQYYDIKIPYNQGYKTYKISCPFHSETNPSFTVYTETNSFYCFSCNKGGDSINFIREMEGSRFYPALKILSRIGGYEISADVLKEISQTFGGVWSSPEQVKKLFETRKYEEWTKLVQTIAEEFKRFYQQYSGWEDFYKTYIEYWWDEFEVITMGSMTIEKLDVLKDWLVAGKKFVRKVAPAWREFGRFKRRLWEEKVGKI